MSFLPPTFTLFPMLFSATLLSAFSRLSLTLISSQAILSDVVCERVCEGIERVSEGVWSVCVCGVCENEVSDDATQIIDSQELWKKEFFGMESPKAKEIRDLRISRLKAKESRKFSISSLSSSVPISLDEFSQSIFGVASGGYSILSDLCQCVSIVAENCQNKRGHIVNIYERCVERCLEMCVESSAAVSPSRGRATPSPMRSPRYKGITSPKRAHVMTIPPLHQLYSISHSLSLNLSISLLVSALFQCTAGDLSSSALSSLPSLLISLTSAPLIFVSNPLAASLSSTISLTELLCIAVSGVVSEEMGRYILMPADGSSRLGMLVPLLKQRGETEGMDGSQSKDGAAHHSTSHISAKPQNPFLSTPIPLEFLPFASNTFGFHNVIDSGPNILFLPDSREKTLTHIPDVYTSTQYLTHPPSLTCGSTVLSFSRQHGSLSSFPLLERCWRQGGSIRGSAAIAFVCGLGLKELLRCCGVGGETQREINMKSAFRYSSTHIRTHTRAFSRFDQADILSERSSLGSEGCRHGRKRSRSCMQSSLSAHSSKFPSSRTTRTQSISSSCSSSSSSSLHSLKQLSTERQSLVSWIQRVMCVCVCVCARVFVVEVPQEIVSLVLGGITTHSSPQSTRSSRASSEECGTPPHSIPGPRFNIDTETSTSGKEATYPLNLSMSVQTLCQLDLFLLMLLQCGGSLPLFGDNLFSNCLVILAAILSRHRNIMEQISHNSSLSSKSSDSPKSQPFSSDSLILSLFPFLSSSHFLLLDYTAKTISSLLQTAVYLYEADSSHDPRCEMVAEFLKVSKERQSLYPGLLPLLGYGGRNEMRDAELLVAALKDNCNGLFSQESDLCCMSVCRLMLLLKEDESCGISTHQRVKIVVREILNHTYTQTQEEQAETLLKESKKGSHASDSSVLNICPFSPSSLSLFLSHLLTFSHSCSSFSFGSFTHSHSILSPLSISVAMVCVSSLHSLLITSMASLGFPLHPCVCERCGDIMVSMLPSCEESESVGTLMQIMNSLYRVCGRERVEKSKITAKKRGVPRKGPEELSLVNSSASVSSFDGTLVKTAVSSALEVLARDDLSCINLDQIIITRLLHNLTTCLSDTTEVTRKILLERPALFLKSSVENMNLFLDSSIRSFPSSPFFYLSSLNCLSRVLHNLDLTGALEERLTLILSELVLPTAVDTCPIIASSLCRSSSLRMVQRIIAWPKSSASDCDRSRSTVFMLYQVVGECGLSVCDAIAEMSGVSEVGGLVPLYLVCEEEESQPQDRRAGNTGKGKKTKKIVTKMGGTGKVNPSGGRWRKRSRCFSVGGGEGVCADIANVSSLTPFSSTLSSLASSLSIISLLAIPNLALLTHRPVKSDSGDNQTVEDQSTAIKTTASGISAGEDRRAGNTGKGKKTKKIVTKMGGTGKVNPSGGRWRKRSRCFSVGGGEGVCADIANVSSLTPFSSTLSSLASSLSIISLLAIPNLALLTHRPVKSDSGDNQTVEDQSTAIKTTASGISAGEEGKGGRKRAFTLSSVFCWGRRQRRFGGRWRKRSRCFSVGGGEGVCADIANVSSLTPFSSTLSSLASSLSIISLLAIPNLALLTHRPVKSDSGDNQTVEDQSTAIKTTASGISAGEEGKGGRKRAFTLSSAVCDASFLVSSLQALSSSIAHADVDQDCVKELSILYEHFTDIVFNLVTTAANTHEARVVIGSCIGITCLRDLFFACIDTPLASALTLRATKHNASYDQVEGLMGLFLESSAVNVLLCCRALEGVVHQMKKKKSLQREDKRYQSILSVNEENHIHCVGQIEGLSRQIADLESVCAELLERTKSLLLEPRMLYFRDSTLSHEESLAVLCRTLPAAMWLVSWLLQDPKLFSNEVKRGNVMIKKVMNAILMLIDLMSFALNSRLGDILLPPLPPHLVPSFTQFAGASLRDVCVATAPFLIGGLCGVLERWDRQKKAGKGESMQKVLDSHTSEQGVDDPSSELRREMLDSHPTSKQIKPEITDISDPPILPLALLQSMLNTCTSIGMECDGERQMVRLCVLLLEMGLNRDIVIDVLHGECCGITGIRRLIVLLCQRDKIETKSTHSVGQTHLRESATPTFVDDECEISCPDSAEGHQEMSHDQHIHEIIEPRSLQNEAMACLNTLIDSVSRFSDSELMLEPLTRCVNRCIELCSENHLFIAFEKLITRSSLTAVKSSCIIASKITSILNVSDNQPHWNTLIHSGFSSFFSSLALDQHLDLHDMLLILKRHLHIKHLASAWICFLHSSIPFLSPLGDEHVVNCIKPALEACETEDFNSVVKSLCFVCERQRSLYLVEEEKGEGKEVMCTQNISQCHTLLLDLLRSKKDIIVSFAKDSPSLGKEIKLAVLAAKEKEKRKKERERRKHRPKLTLRLK
ncbi:hypothetical protein ADUPG1_007177 [Aduncisulcus paluster]|uniref:Uncharacterized protein n=1 Tax=Aduncisulcus paluster TaxID=2918883 RepID=A0ABQ5KMQ2_9EUKA|nr:hypothetical protein ADUPG1_007177 [Aduncisulcus paluster]